MYPRTLHLEVGQFPGAGKLGLGALVQFMTHVQFMTQHAVGAGVGGVPHLGSSDFSRAINLGRIHKKIKPMGSWKTIPMPGGSPGKVPGGPLEPSHVPSTKEHQVQDSGCTKCPVPGLVGSPLPWCGAVGKGRQFQSCIHLTVWASHGPGSEWGAWTEQ